MPLAIHIDLKVVAQEAGLPLDKVQRSVGLMEEGNTVPFIARYRKDQTGGLDEEQIREIQRHTTRLRLLCERRQTILKSIESQGKLTPELADQINRARSTKRLEDLYLPYKPKKQTLATLARQRGLEPLAREILNGEPAAIDLGVRAVAFVSPDRHLHSVAEVLHGVGHLLAERFSERADVRARLREIVHRTGQLISAQIETARRSDDRRSSPSVATSSEPVSVSKDAPHGAVNEGAQVESVRASGGEPATEPVAAIADASEVTVPTLIPTETSSAVAAQAVDGGLSAQTSAARRSAKASAKERKRRKVEDAFKGYFCFREPISRVPPHRVLAINRGERANVLRVKVEGDTEAMFRAAAELLVAERHPHAGFLCACVRDALNRLIVPSLEREIRRELTEFAEEHAVDVFIRNLRKLLLQPPVRGRQVLAIDPGFKSGCKLAWIDEFGNVIEGGILHIIGGDEKKTQSRALLIDLVRRHQVSVIAIGNGTACRETEQVVAGILATELKDSGVAYVIVNEAGASVYSTSPLGREELPQHDAVMRSAVSIGRRLLDPLSELVKINPANIGVGLYQHDIKARHLRDSLDAVVQSCVNYVGVDVNTASPALLSYVSGLNQLTARRLHEYRLEHGPFRNRAQLREVPGLGEATFVQAAGFLKILDGDNPLDATWIHPESYAFARRVLEKLESNVEELASLLGSRAVRKDSSPLPAAESVYPERVEHPLSDKTLDPPATLAERARCLDLRTLSAEAGIGELALQDIITALTRRSRDPREDLPPPVFRTGIMKIEDLKPGMELSGSVLNVVDFGAFVDIGISESALVHISRLVDRYVRDPHEVVSVGDILTVWVLTVDKERRRVSLTAVRPGSERKQKDVVPRSPKEASRAPQQAPSQQPGSVPQGRGTQPKGSAPRRPLTSQSNARAKQKPKPVTPITQAMVEGREPMRSFTDLLQFYERKPQQGREDKPQQT